MSRSGRRGPWLPEEDATLLHLVRTQGPNNWVRISEHMQHRSPKQCRERYHQNLKPSLNHDPISSEEGEVIEQLVRDMGKRWAEIARRLGNRSDNAVKNWWNGSMNRRKRSTGAHGAVSKMVGYRTQPILASASSHPLKQLYLPEQLALPPFSASDPFHRPEISPSSTLGMRPERRYDLLPRPDGRQLSVQTDCRSLLYPGGDQQILSPLQPHSASANLPSPGGKPLLGIHNWSPSRLECQLPPLNWSEAPVPSPAATEASQGSYPLQAPSLVSDNQSNCSISPKTVTSPRPGGTVGKLPSIDLWPEMHRRNSTGNYPDAEIDGSWKSRSEQDSQPYRSAERAGSVPEITVGLGLPRPPSPQNAANDRLSLNTTARYSPCPSSGKPNSPSEKDTRMKVARLLE
ncbi:uncharacterized protein Z520_03601 [Fonsecaea multimorphosa CBS 102226]|uniref:Myb-like DNA-binding protein FlbD n=1 Tax=Fonsecaea multimorphosa CBS 102226 TaxID=1442371 RepID=A0A0D2KCP7_9EURO|nr:uncharacterized protein Z520_03601 [Fonsecaea multimorphosa CBS 102226]KIY00935.1 hypothetical protein Z520_03601 [Fonsecaea multimorphosa CBS 102226]OAL27519.1 hypothetical protein AYO22_03423 [Fonsecaea multimorphosa]